jgi:integrase
MARHEWVRREGWRIRKPYLDHGRLTWRLRHEATGERQWFRARSDQTYLAHQEFELWFTHLLEAYQQAEAERARGYEEVSLRYCFETWLEVVRDDVRDATWQDYRQVLLAVACASWKDREGKDPYVHEIDLEAVEWLLVAVARQRRWSGRTRRKYYQLLNRVFAWAVRRKWTGENPVAHFLPPKKWGKDIKAAGTRGVALTQDQLRALLTAAREDYGIEVTCQRGRRRGRTWTQTGSPPPYLYTAILLAARVGLRRRNVRELRWEHLREAQTVVAIPAEEMKAAVAFEAPLHPEVTAHLRSLLRQHSRAPAPSDLVLGLTGTHSEFKYAFTSAARRAGVEKIEGKALRYHDLRHTFATHLAQRCTFAAVRQLLGHARASVTDLYVHLSMDELREEVGKLEWLYPSVITNYRKKV